MAADQLKLAKGEISPEEFRRNRERSSPLGSYDAQFLLAIHNHWNGLIDQERILGPVGTVRVDFHLHQDGSVSAFTATQINSGLLTSLTCQRAVLDLVPFPAWSSGVVEEIGSTQRLVTLIFCHTGGLLRGDPWQVEEQRPHLVAELREGSGPRLRAPPSPVSAPGQPIGLDPGPLWPYYPYDYLFYQRPRWPVGGHHFRGWPRPPIPSPPVSPPGKGAAH
ncbi:MAG: hypothetical protein NTW03_03170 [Verrucomicrobia bacterium]|nr:hypothetical protein [Verrucomicrobiota bacterium]